MSDKPAIDMAIYRAAHQRRRQQEAERLRQRAQEARQVAERAAAYLKAEYEVTAVILFGSVARGTGFRADSDIDLAVVGLNPRYFWRAWSELDRVVGTDFEIDLIHMDTTKPPLRSAIEREGILL